MNRQLRRRLITLSVILLISRLGLWEVHAANPPPSFKPLLPAGLNSALRPVRLNFEVSPTGVATWSMPIWTPPGRHGIEPSLTFSYSSRSSAGILGRGFAIGGLSSIARCWTTPAQDGTYSDGASAGVPDAFCLDGQRLVPAGTAIAGELQPELDQGTIVRISGNASSPDWFEVRYRDGRIARFGQRDIGASRSGSRVRARPLIVSGTRSTGAKPAWDTDLLHESTGPDETTLAWNMDLLQDRFGNFLEVDYERTITPAVAEVVEQPPAVPFPRIVSPAMPETVEVVPKEIRWTGYSGTGSAIPTTRRVRFNYAAAPRLDARVVFRGGIAVKESRLLDSLQVRAQDRLVSDDRAMAAPTERVFREYRFVYETPRPGTRILDRLQSITECAISSAGLPECLDPVVFSWSGLNNPATPTFAAGVSLADGIRLSPPLGLPWWAADVLDMAVGDFDGDGRDDILYRLPAVTATGGFLQGTDDAGLPLAAGEWFIRLGAANGLGARIPASGLPTSPGGDWKFSPRVIDLDGDGRSEVVLYREPLPASLGGVPGGPWTGGQRETNAFRFGCGATGCEFTVVPGWGEIQEIPNLIGYPRRSFLLTLGDFDGDGRPDIIRENALAGQPGGALTSLVFRRGARGPALAAPGGTVPVQEAGANVSVGLFEERYVVDVDGNGRAELLTATHGRTQSPSTLGFPVTLSIVSPSATSTAGEATNVESTLHSAFSENSDLVRSVFQDTCLGPAPMAPATPFSRWFLDINGDGLKDSVAIPSAFRDNCPTTRTLRPRVLVSTNTGSLFRAAQITSLAPPYTINPTMMANTVGPAPTDDDPMPVTTVRRTSMDPGVRVIDLDRDGRDDLLLVSSSTDRTMPRTNGMVLLRWDGTTFTGSELSVPVTGNTWNDRSGYSGGYGPRLTQLGDFNGDGFVDIVSYDSASSALKVYLQQAAEPDVITSISAGPNSAALSMEYALASVTNPAVYTRATSCQWPQICPKSMGWVVKRHSVEATDFDRPSPVRNVFEYKYQGARADSLGRGFLGVDLYTVTMFDDAAVPRVLSEVVSEFDLRSISDRQTLDFPRYAYPGIRAPSRVVKRVFLDGGRVNITEIANRPSLSPLAGPFGYHLDSSATVITESEGPSANPGVLSSTRIWSIYDEFGNRLSQQSDTSALRIPLDGPLAPGQQLITTVNRAAGANAADRNAWLVSRYPSYEFESIDPTLPATATPDLVQSVALTYEPASTEVKTKTVQPNPPAPESPIVSGFTLLTEITRDPQGTPIRVVESGSGMNRETDWDFDPNDVDRIFPSITTNSLAQKSQSWVHAALGVVIAEDDVNDLRTEYSYDSLGRLREQHPPGVPATTFDYYSDRAVNGSRLRTRTFCRRSPTSGSTCVSVDPHDRSLRETWEGFAMQVRRTRTWDRFGHLTSETLPQDASILPNGLTVDYAYDPLGRLLSRKRPGETPQSNKPSFSVSYEGRSVRTFNERGIVTVSEFDSRKRLVKQSTIEPPNGREVSTSVSYWHFDLPWRVTHPILPPQQAMNPPAAALVTKIDYDVLGRRESLDDPNAGLTSYRYNAFGETKRMEDANGGVTSYSYDSLGRLQRSETPANAAYPSQPGNAWAQQTILSWDGASFGKGKLQSVTSNNGVVVEFEYDALSRRSNTTWTGAGASYSLSRTYNSNGQLLQLTYPPSSGQPFVIEYTYGSNGAIQDVYDASQSASPRLIWHQVAADPAGRSTEEQFGLSEKIRHVYDAAGQLRFLEGTFLANQAVFQRLVYTWDLDGLPNKLLDLESGVEQSFHHDFLDRLDTWEIKQNCFDIKWQYEYDDWGNLRSRKPMLGLPPAASTTCEYTAVGNVQQPQAIKRLIEGTTSEDYSYLPGGQMTSGRGNEFTWTPFGLPTRIRNTATAEQADYSYDGLGNRIAVRRQLAGDSVQTLTLGGLFERHVTIRGAAPEQVEYVYNVIGGRGLAAQVRRTSNPFSERTFFFHPDALGNPDVVTVEAARQATAAGAIADSGKYEPFGERRYPWAIGQPKSQAHQPNATIGFTGHRPEDSFGLIDMTGRYYDARTARFLSPDPLTGAYDSEWLNRYSYARNSPVALVDRLGYQAETPGGTGAASDPDLWTSWEEATGKRRFETVVETCPTCSAPPLISAPIVSAPKSDETAREAPPVPHVSWGIWPEPSAAYRASALGAFDAKVGHALAGIAHGGIGYVLEVGGEASLELGLIGEWDREDDEERLEETLLRWWVAGLEYDPEFVQFGETLVDFLSQPPQPGNLPMRMPPSTELPLYANFGAKIPKVAKSATIGQEAHRQILKYKYPSWTPEVTIQLFRRKGEPLVIVRKDGMKLTKNGAEVLIIKPDTPSGRAAAARRTRLMQMWGYGNVKVEFYNPKDKAFVPGSKTYIGPSQ